LTNEAKTATGAGPPDGAAGGTASTNAGTVDVTVVVCTRNRLAWLRECVASVLAQRGVAFELLVVDDASTDGTREWLCSIAGPDVAILLPPSQLLRARAANLALPRARGRYVMFLDDDDLLRSDALRVLASALDTHPEAVAAVGARWTWFTTEGYERRDAHPRRPQLRDVFDELMFGWSAVSGQNLYRTATVREVGGYTNGLSPCDDRDLWLRIAARGKVVLRPEIVVTYRLHAGQWRPENLRHIRERVARRAIRSLPPAKRRHALRLRRANAWLDQAEDTFTEGRFAAGLGAAFRAVAAAPSIYRSPLVGEWVARRLGGRIARRLVPPRTASEDPEHHTDGGRRGVGD